MSDAQVTIGAETSAVQNAAKATIALWKGVGSSVAEGFATAARSVSSDLAQIALAQGRVSFSGQHAQVREFEAATAHLAVSMGTNLETVRRGFEQTGVAIGKRPGEVAAWATEVGKLTYSFEGASEAIKGVSGLAAQTGRSVDEYKGLAVELGTVGAVAGDTTHAVSVLAAQANALGTKGGVAAFTDQVQALGEVISHFAVKSEADFLKVTAGAGLLTKGLSPQTAQRVQQQALGFVASNAIPLQRYLGHKITDEHGQIQDPTKVLQEVRDKVKKQYRDRAQLMLGTMLGSYEAGTALLNADFSQKNSLANLAPANVGGTAQAALNRSDAGQRAIAEATSQRSARDLSGASTALGGAADALQKFAASNPISSTLLATAGGTAISGALGKIFKLPAAITGAGGDVIGNLLGIGGGGKGKGGMGGGGGVTHVWVDNPGFGGAGGESSVASTAGTVAKTAAGALGVGAAAVGTVAALVGGVMAVAKYQEVKNKKTVDSYNTAHPVDEQAAGIFGTEYARQHKIVMRRGGMQVFPSEKTAEAKEAQADLNALTKAVQAGMKEGVKVTIVNSTGGPVESVNQSSASGAAGSQASSH